MKQLVPQNESKQGWVQILALGKQGIWKQAAKLREHFPPPGRSQRAPDGQGTHLSQESLEVSSSTDMDIVIW